ncbi:MAG: Inner membrane protein YidH [Candidatus Erwinia impunctatus]|nr:Inner membrane protein YidH [Culicoides impunctatus]
MREGKAPDYRYSLANERTFLAWIRTALAFLATAIGIDILLHEQGSAVVRHAQWLVNGLALVAVIIGGWAFIR